MGIIISTKGIKRENIMGGGGWTKTDWDSYATKTVKGKTTKAIYSSRNMKKDFDPKNIDLRESIDSHDNPISNAIIIALDVTGSMSNVSDAAMRGLDTLVTELIDRKPVSNPHIMCMGIGDAEAGDKAPLQVTQFEADIRIASQLKDIWLEGGGGGNKTESYHLAWYFAAMHTKIACMKKRNKKGYLFTIGDEQLLGSLPKNSIENVFGDKSSIQNDIPIEDLFAMVSRDYEVFHIIVEEGSNCRYDPQAVIDSWTKVIGQRAIPLSDITKLSETIVSTIQVVEGEDKTKVSTSWKNGSKVVERAIANINKRDIVLDDGITTL